MNRVVLPVVLASLLSCRENPAPPPAAAASQKFFTLMEANDTQLAGLTKEVQRRAGAEAYRKRTTMLRNLATQAMALRVKETEKDQQALLDEFNKFIADLEGADGEWPDKAEAGVKRIEAACNRCHSRFKED
jgi:cytochrome c556